MPRHDEGTTQTQISLDDDVAKFYKKQNKLSKKTYAKNISKVIRKIAEIDEENPNYAKLQREHYLHVSKEEELHAQSKNERRLIESIELEMAEYKRRKQEMKK